MEQFRREATTCLAGVSVPDLKSINDQEVDNFIRAFKVALDGAHSVEQIQKLSEDMDRFQKEIYGAVQKADDRTALIDRVKRASENSAQ